MMLLVIIEHSFAEFQKPEYNLWKPLYFREWEVRYLNFLDIFSNAFKVFEHSRFGFSFQFFARSMFRYWKKPLCFSEERFCRNCISGKQIAFVAWKNVCASNVILLIKDSWVRLLISKNNPDNIIFHNACRTRRTVLLKFPVFIRK